MACDHAVDRAETAPPISWRHVWNGGDTMTTDRDREVNSEQARSCSLLEAWATGWIVSEAAANEAVEAELLKQAWEREAAARRAE